MYIMQRRLDLHEILCNLLGTRYVYFQPPASIYMKFPCIIYSLDRVNIDHADNLGYLKRDRYEIIYVDRNVDSPIPDMIGELESASFNRYYIADNLNHFVYQLYF